MTSKGVGFLPVPGFVVALAAAVAVSGCAGGEGSEDGTYPGTEPNVPPEEEYESEEIANIRAELGQEQEGSELFDENAVGEEPVAELRITDEGADVTSYQLEVTGFAENEFYLATVHVEACGSDPEASGELYEGDEDTEEAPEGELDKGSVMIQLGTDADGSGRGQIQLDDEPDDGLGSLLISTDPTAGAEEPAPQDGDPVACMDLET
ncbi:hypothetical protein [Nocardiopsis kunsanensis]|uniref:Lipoprotein n=1 Tax=Nocardiopsis kunsanensis TaxID=141693 RepID=A0A918X7L6_9ACTN|nr:hypothetical protein [Nocardiopsis kunsanensis]GHD16343.1 hypothetical protein GCM10007147_04330 [Nocardiopsis kunsanensis]